MNSEAQKSEVHGNMLVATANAPGGISCLWLAGDESDLARLEACGRLPGSGKNLAFRTMNTIAGEMVDDVIVAKPYNGLRLVSGHGGIACTERLAAHIRSLGFQEVEPEDFPALPWPGADCMLARTIDRLLAGVNTEKQAAFLLKLRERIGKSSSQAAVTGEEVLALVRAEDRQRLLDVHDLVIVGGPNVGKSSIFNLLAGRERSLVHEQAGTTVDVVTEVCDVAGYAVRVRDFPAPGQGEWGAWEKRRCGLEAEPAVLLVLDAARELGDADMQVVEAVDNVARVLVILNKSDLLRQVDADAVGRMLPGRCCVDFSVMEHGAQDKLWIDILRLYHFNCQAQSNGDGPRFG